MWKLLEDGIGQLRLDLQKAAEEVDQEIYLNDMDESLRSDQDIDEKDFKITYKTTQLP